MTALPDFNATNIAGIFSYINILTENWFGNLLPLSFFIIMFISMRRYEFEKTLLAASFGTLLFTIFLWLAGITQEGFVVLFSILTGVGVLLNIL